jgi:predicted DNA-binding transcriptional regulator
VIEAFVGAIGGFLGVCADVLRASIGPWRYLLSKRYREGIHEKCQGAKLCRKIVDVLFGTAAVVASILITVGGLYLILAPEPEPSAIEKFKEEVTERVIEVVKENMKKAE